MTVGTVADSDATGCRDDSDGKIGCSNEAARDFAIGPGSCLLVSLLLCGLTRDRRVLCLAETTADFFRRAGDNRLEGFRPRGDFTAGLDEETGDFLEACLEGLSLGIVGWIVHPRGIITRTILNAKQKRHPLTGC